MDYTTVSRERWQDHWLFLTHFRKSPRTVGAIAPSSRRLARAMLDGLPIDHIVSGLPFASLPAASARAIVDAIVSSLRVGGSFTTFQYVHAYGFSSAMAVRETLTREMGTAPTRSLVVGNLPPALVLRWRKHR